MKRDCGPLLAQEVLHRSVPYADVLVRIGTLVSELRASKPMCEQLLKDLEEVRPRLEELIASDGVHYVGALKLYEELVNTFRAALEDYSKLNVLARIFAHKKLKDRIQQFNNSLDHINILMELDWQREDNRRHKEVVSTLERVEERSLQANESTSESLVELFNTMKTQPAEFAKLLKGQKVSLEDVMDFAKEIKFNKAAYSSEDLKKLDDVLNKTKEVLELKLPHISRWYMPRGDILYDNGNPFATSDNNERALHYGTIFSGTKVVVKTVEADDNPDEIRDKFNAEVKRWNELRHPHILPLYGANNVGTPLLLVMGRAEGNFRDYLATHRHRVWSLFLDAARGLAYLHKYKVVHGNLKCSNLLVNSQGVGMVADFGFAFTRLYSAMSAKPQPATFQWKAPECFDQNSGGRLESDVYALGMCLFEAFTDSVPYSNCEERVAIEMIEQGKLPTADNDDAVPSEAWELIRGMCKRQFNQRTSLSDVIVTLERHSTREQLRNTLAKCCCQSPCCSSCHRPVKLSSIGPKIGLVNRSGTMKW